MAPDLLSLALGCLLWALLVAEHRQLRGRVEQQDYERWRHLQFVLAEVRAHRRLWRVRYGGANGVVLDTRWYTESGGARGSAARSARPGVSRGQPSAPALPRCGRRLRTRRRR